MCDQTKAPAEAYAPDADRAGPDAFAPPPEWLVHILAMLILFLPACMILYGLNLIHASWSELGKLDRL